MRYFTIAAIIILTLILAGLGWYIMSSMAQTSGEKTMEHATTPPQHVKLGADPSRPMAAPEFPPVALCAMIVGVVGSMYWVTAREENVTE